MASRKREPEHIECVAVPVKFADVPILGRLPVFATDYMASLVDPASIEEELGILINDRRNGVRYLVTVDLVTTDTVRTGTRSTTTETTETAVVRDLIVFADDGATLRSRRELGAYALAFIRDLEQPPVDWRRHPGIGAVFVLDQREESPRGSRPSIEAVAGAVWEAIDQGAESVWEFVAERFGVSRPTVNRWIRDVRTADASLLPEQFRSDKPGRRPRAVPGPVIATSGRELGGKLRATATLEGIEHPNPKENDRE